MPFYTTRFEYSCKRAISDRAIELSCALHIPDILIIIAIILIMALKFVCFFFFVSLNSLAGLTKKAIHKS